LPEGVKVELAKEWRDLLGGEDDGEPIQALTRSNHALVFEWIKQIIAAVYPYRSVLERPRRTPELKAIFQARPSGCQGRFRGHQEKNGSL
jgi:hypothetical protein